MQCFFSQS